MTTSTAGGWVARHRALVIAALFLMVAMAVGAAVVAPRALDWYRERGAAQPGDNPYVELPWGAEQVLGLGAPQDVPPPANVTSVADGYEWRQRPVGGGGWVTGLEVHHSGAPILSRGDLGGAFRWDPDTERWQQMLIHDNVTDPVMSDYLVEAIAIAPSDPDVLYVSGGDSDDPTGRVLRSDDGGDTWVAGTQRFAIGANRELRQGGERLAVSPSDPMTVWMSTRREGLHRSTDGGITWELLDAVPFGDWTIPEPGGNPWVLLADEDGTETVYVAVNGDGVYRAAVADAADPAAWQRIVETTGVPFDAEIGPDGRVWMTDLGTGDVHRYVPGEANAEKLQPGIDDARVLAVDPNDAARVLVMSHRQVRRSDDGGDSWRSLDFSFSCPGAPWLDQYTFSLFLGSSSPEFDVDDAGGLWFPQGFGVWYADATGDRLDFRCRTFGFEELATNDLVVNAAGELVTAHWDRAIFRHTNDDETGAIQGPETRFNSAWDFDMSPSDPDVIVGIIADHRLCCEEDDKAYNSGWSPDGGVTWNRFESYDGDHPAELRFGNIAAAADDVDNLVWLPSFNGALHTSFDRGATWERIELPGTEDMVNSATGRWQGGSHFAVYLHRQVLAADPVLPGTFYVYHAELGLFRSSDGGSSWALVSDESLPSGWSVGWFNAHLKAVPGEPGHLYFTPGKLSGQFFPLYESFDGGETWTAHDLVTDVGALGFGAALESDGPATLYFAGTVGSQRGVWRAPAGTQEWELVSTAPAGNYSEIYSLAGDPTVPGRVYVGFRGSGIVQGDG